MEYQYTSIGAERIFLYGVVTLEIGTGSFPVHRDLMHEYSFFKNLPGDTRTIKMDPKIVTPNGLDVILCLQYPHCRKIADIFEDPVTWAEALVAWDFFGGPDPIGNHLALKLFDKLPPKEFDIMQFPVGLEDLLIRHGYEQTRTEIARLKAAVTPEGQARLAAQTELEQLEQSTSYEFEPERLTIKELQFELNTGKKQRLKSELVKAVRLQRAALALGQLLAACVATQEEREQLYQDIRNTHDKNADEATAYHMLSDGSIRKGWQRGRCEDSIVPGPEHIRRHFFWGCGEQERPFYLNEPCAVSTDLEQLMVLRNRMKRMFL